MASGKFLGYLVSQRGIKANPDQISAILNMKSPTCVKEVQVLTGGLAALNRFLSKSTDKCKSFFQTICKNAGAFIWDLECETTLQHLKQYLTTPPVLSKPSPGERLFVYLAVSDVAVSGALVREDNGVQKLVYFVSKSLLDAETRYPKLEKLVLALKVTTGKLRHYFLSHHVTVFSEYPLGAIIKDPEVAGRIARWKLKLSEYSIDYQPRTAIKGQVLADFVAEFTPSSSTPTSAEDNGVWILYVDGASNNKDNGA